MILRPQVAGQRLTVPLKTISTLGSLCGVSTPSQFRQLCREDKFQSPTAGILPNRVQCNLVILPHRYAYDFLLFCQRNPKPCPLLEVTEVGSPLTKYLAQDADLRTDLPLYRVYKAGTYSGQLTSIKSLWQPDFVGFLLGCSFSFEAALISSGLRVRHIDENVNVPMYKTNIKCVPAGIFKGNMVVTMRPYKPSEVPQAIAVTARYPRVSA